MSVKTIYFAGGCFGGCEKVFQKVPGVKDTEVGYANGWKENPTYEEVCGNETGHRETVKVTYEDKEVSLTTLLKVYFLVIDPTLQNQQGNDIGTQYQTGVYYEDEEDLPIIQATFEAEKKKVAHFYVECEKLKCFYTAEEYHQDYLIKNPNGYCHITNIEMEEVQKLLEGKL